jgi:hypothetical protein
MANLAFTLESMGRHDDALCLIEACFDLRQRVLGKEHPHTIFTLSTLKTWQAVYQTFTANDRG